MLVHAGVVADVGALHPEDDVFGNIGGVVGDTLEIARHQQRVERLPHHIRALVHGLHQLDEGIVFHAIDDVIHFEDSLRQFGLAFDEGFESAPHHGAHRRTHARDVHGQIRGGHFDHVHHALGNVHGLIADALQIGVDLGHRQDEAQIHCHGLLHGQQIEGGLVDLALTGIDQALAFENHLATTEVAVDVGLTRAIHRLLRQPTHAKQLLPQIVEPLLKARAHYPNLPVM